MRKIQINVKGEVLDRETGKVIGKTHPDGRIELFEGEKMPASTETQNGSQNASQNVDSPSETAEKKEEIAPQEKSASPAVPPSPSLSIPAPKQYSRYEVSPESEFTVRFCLHFRDGRVLVYTEDEKTRHPEFELHWVKFRMWKYSEEMKWRQQCQEFDPKTRGFRVNTDRFNELKLRNLIKSWSLEEYDPKFRLLHVNGVLSDESNNMLMGLFPSIIENIIYLMNSVLEGNQ